MRSMRTPHRDIANLLPRRRSAVLILVLLAIAGTVRPARAGAGADDAAIARRFLPRFKFAAAARCHPLSYHEISPSASAQERDALKKRCNSSLDPGFVVFASVKRPDGAATAAWREGSYRVTYAVAFGWQQGTFTGLTPKIIDLFGDAGDHAEDSQSLVVDVVRGSVSSVWANLHQGYYTRVRSQLGMHDEQRVNVWVGAYYHPLKLTSDTSTVCSVWESVPESLKILCDAKCKIARKNHCGEFDTLMNWGDPVGSAQEGDGKLVMIDDLCSTTGTSYRSPDGIAYGGTQLDALKAFAGCSGKSTPGVWGGYITGKKHYSDPYALEGCKDGNQSGGSICNATIFASGQTWPALGADRYLDPTVAGSADVDYAAGAPFNDASVATRPPASLTIRTGKCVDAVSTTWATSSTASHGGSGGNAQTLANLAKDPVVSVALCEASSDGRVRVGAIRLTTAAGRTLSGGEGSQNCRTIAPANRQLLGFYGRSGDEIDVLGTIWGKR